MKLIPYKKNWGRGTGFLPGRAPQGPAVFLYDHSRHSFFIGSFFGRVKLSSGYWARGVGWSSFPRDALPQGSRIAARCQPAPQTPQGHWGRGFLEYKTRFLVLPILPSGNCNPGLAHPRKASASKLSLACQSSYLYLHSISVYWVLNISCVPGTVPVYC